MKHPEDAEIFIGESVTFVAEITSKGPVTVDWLRGDEMLSRDERIEMLKEKNLYKLIISDAKIDDEGFYKCVASYEAGKIEYEFELLVEGELNSYAVTLSNTLIKV